MDHLSMDERIARIDEVGISQVAEVAGEILSGPRVIGAVGPFEEGDLDGYVS